MHYPLIRPMAAAALTALFLAAPAWAALKPGAKAPDFSADASLAGKDFKFSLGAALKKGPVVLYFYPSAYTGGCDLEAHTFAAGKPQFDAAGATILGVSADDLERLNAFSLDPNYCAGQFPVATDAGGAIASSFGLDMAPPKSGATDVRGVKIGHGFIPRTTFVIAADGKIAAVLSSKTDSLTPDQHMQKSLAIVLQLRVGKAKGN
ncbi:MAG TPA: peroxiredoxin [bacterium]|jgi:peroxiredoxin Q/BCP|nr:peroxiredoxin [bacterium]